MHTNSKIIKLPTGELNDALELIEQQCQTIRWRLSNFDDSQSIRSVGTEIRTLAGLSYDVSRLYGRLETLTGTAGAADAAPIPPLPDAGEVNAAILDTELAASGSVETTYDVIRVLGDTEIVEVAWGNGEYSTFEAAKSAAVDYLEDATDLCESAIEGLRDADTPEQYFGTEQVTDPDKEGNVQFTCGGHYQPGQEVQGRPLDWFLDKVVKLRFPIPGRPKNGELMWVAVNSIRGEELVGTLTNEPLFADESYGDEIVFRREEVLVVHESSMVV